MTERYAGRVLGDLPDTCHKTEVYFLERFCFIDARGPLVIHADCLFGIGVKVITMGHDLSGWPDFGPWSPRGVTVDEGAWIASFSILHNCHIHAHAIVSIGAVVNGLSVPEYGIVQGNPASLMGYYYQGVVWPREQWTGPF